ncbi:hypothetical protein TBLA_0A08940 [Henningerozyma blattae CBS 6284]|uniref:Glycoside hydrolase family 17 protein n=1 Tax=Henningerozyma blattae (strain ATCC 34711 / CBS 6284 / DSM 70876 / NBRC 10599 / NRRL Y-10934 / UCD 77-7) TaxID=1071380 RepID=I2GX31_HENB6|nr:hypothetical protein TBLA_0A08940 [Tetrapisispora blattae CBS 6284]CCH58683.1 hypothetical protein TBLA_0A08940 [Tetrapisispora blattae CBS 6284]
MQYYLLIALLFTLTNALPLPIFQKRKYVTRMHTASTSTFTDVYSTTTEIVVAPTVEFIISDDLTFTTTLYPSGVDTNVEPTTTLTSYIIKQVSGHAHSSNAPATSQVQTVSTTVIENTPTTSAAPSPSTPNTLTQQTSTQQTSTQQTSTQQTSTQQTSTQQTSTQQTSTQQTSTQQTSTQQTSSVVDKQISKVASSTPQTSTSQTSEEQTFIQLTSTQQTSTQQTSTQQTSEQQASTQQTSEQQASTQQTSEQQTSTQQTSEQQTSTQQTSEQQTSTQQTSEQQTFIQLTSTQKTSTQQTSTQQTSTQQTSTQQTSTQQTSTQQTSSQQAPSLAPSSAVDKQVSTAASAAISSLPTALTYSPYNNDGTCKDGNTVQSDLQLIKSKGVSKIRVYGVDCNSLETVNPVAAKLGITINQGLWISGSGVDSIDSGVQSLISYGQTNGWGVFQFITIGNEAVLSGFCSVNDLINKISSVKQQLRNAGYNGLVTTSEPPVTFENNPSLCTSSDIDFVGINVHSYFDVNSQASTAGSFLKGQVAITQNVCGSKNVVVTETGYPSAGIQNGGNIPSKQNQIIAVNSILSDYSTDVTILSTFDDLWKSPGPYGIEQSFGIIYDLA